MLHKMVKESVILRSILGNEFIDWYTLSPEDLISAVTANDKETVKRYIASRKDTKNDQKLLTEALGLAIGNNNADIIALLLQAGCDVNRKSYGHTPLTLAICFRLNDIARLLIQAGADVDATNTTTDDENETALMVAAKKGNINGVHLLIEAEANVNKAKSDSGKTALMFAAEYKRADVVEALVMADANVNLMTICKVNRGNGSRAFNSNVRSGAIDPYSQYNGWTALTYAVQNDDIKIANILLLAKANPNIEYGYGLASYGIMPTAHSTPFMMAAGHNNTDMARVLIAHGANVNYSDAYSGSATHAASHHGNVEMLDLLISHGANVNAIVRENLYYGDTALMVAARNYKHNEDHNLGVIIALLKAGADVTATNSYRETALTLAKATLHNDSVINVLENANAEADAKAAALTEAKAQAEAEAKAELIAICAKLQTVSDNPTTMFNQTDESSLKRKNSDESNLSPKL